TPIDVVHSRPAHVLESGVARLLRKRTRVEIQPCGRLEPVTLRTGGEQQVPSFIARSPDVRQNPNRSELLQSVQEHGVLHCAPAPPCPRRWRSLLGTRR